MVMEFMNDAEFETWLHKHRKDPEKLSEFITRQQYKQSKDTEGVKEHLKTLNGTVAELKADQIVIKLNQVNLIGRIWSGLPGWLQKIIIVWVALSLLSSVAIPVLCTVCAMFIVK